MSAGRPALGVVVAGGGTGGHLFPGIAVAQRFAAKIAGARLLFVGTGRPFESAAVGRAGFAHHAVAIEGIKGRGWKKALAATFKVPRAILDSMRLLARFHPHLIFGVGGYASAPTVAAGWLTGKAVVLQEQNLLPGIANRILSPLAQRVYVSFPETAGHFSRRKVRVCGNPVRREVIDAAKRAAGRRNGALTVLILGGSQGAHGINTAVVDALAHIEHRSRLRFIHQTGEADRAGVRAAYAEAGVEADVRTFFHDVGRIFGEADLVICRAGATTVAELTAIGKAVVFVPFPHAADDHQTKNAASLARRGAAEMIAESDLSGERLARKIDDFIGQPERLQALARRAKQFGRPEAVEVIVDDCLRLLEKKGLWRCDNEQRTDDG